MYLVFLQKHYQTIWVNFSEMETVIIVIHLMVVLAMVLVVLLQRSEGGALGIGGGGGGGMMANRSAGNPLTRATSILAIIFFATSLGLTIWTRQFESAPDILRELTPEISGPVNEADEGSDTPANVLDALREESGLEEEEDPEVPETQ